MAAPTQELAIPVDLALSVSLGASVAFAGRGALAQEKLWRTPALWALVMFEVMIFLPLAGYLGHRYPDWSVMYLFDAASLPLVVKASTLALYPIVAIGSFAWTRRLLIGGRTLAAVGLVASGALSAGLIAYVGQDALLTVGTTAAYKVEAPTLRQLHQTALPYLLIAATLGMTLAWAAMLWRVALVTRVATRKAQKADASPAHQKKAGFGPRTQPLKAAPKKK